MPAQAIKIIGARQHNLKNLTLEIPREKLVVITGLSGSGKSSLAFDTLYAEGQRRYVESLRAYARQFLDQMQKPDVDFIEGLSPAIAIEQRALRRPTRARPSPPPRRFTITCGSFSPPWASRTIRHRRAHLQADRADRSWTRSWPTRRRRRSCILAPIVRGAGGRVPRRAGEDQARGLCPRAHRRRDHRARPGRSRSGWTKPKRTPSRSWWTGSSSATASARGWPIRRHRAEVGPAAG